MEDICQKTKQEKELTKASSSRRKFFKVAGATGAAAGRILAACNPQTLLEEAAEENL